MSRRRFRMADNAIYHKVFDAEKSYSIKSPESNSPSHKLADRAGCESLQRELEQKISEREHRVNEIEQHFKRYKAQCSREGRKVPRKMEEVSTFFNDWLEAVARLDVAAEELDLVEEKLAVFAAAEQKARNEACLQYGPIGIAKLRGGLLSIIDGQNVEVDSEGILRIRERNSPYDGMIVADYKQYVVIPYKTARAQLQQKQLEDLIQQQREHPGLALPENPPMLPMRKINKATLPPWPSEVPKPKELQ